MEVEELASLRWGFWGHVAVDVMWLQDVGSECMFDKSFLVRWEKSWRC